MKNYNLITREVITELIPFMGDLIDLRTKRYMLEGADEGNRAKYILFIYIGLTKSPEFIVGNILLYLLSLESSRPLTLEDLKLDLKRLYLTCSKKSQFDEDEDSHFYLELSEFTTGDIYTLSEGLLLEGVPLEDIKTISLKSHLEIIKEKYPFLGIEELSIIENYGDSLIRSLSELNEVF